MAYDTPNMGLRAWDEGDDLYSHAELASNFVAVDEHDHTPGKGVQIPTGGIEDDAITEDKIANGAVGTDQLQDGSVTGDKLGASVVPLGLVHFWYRQLGEPIPTDYELCDGRAWSSIVNDLGYTTGNIPNLVGAFVKGVNLASIGQTGGSNTVDLSHTHTVTSHTHNLPSHTHTVPAHGHNVSAHSHPIPTQVGLRFLNDNGNPVTLLQRGVPEGGGANRQFAYVPALNEDNDPSASAVMESHSHGGATTASGTTTDSTALTTNPGGPGATDPTSPGTGGATPGLSSVSIQPNYVGLLPIMKVRN